MEWTLEYNGSFGNEDEHRLNALGGYSWEENEYSYMKAANRNFYNRFAGR